ncbi:MAG: PEP-CTERM sorting domain-containing protein [Planctomycetia bacterium]|nr:PEP-CTERM sorting domain-containing protein [Planctomycetia bacterium]
MLFKSFSFLRGSPLFASAALVATGLAAGSASATAITVLNSNFASVSTSSFINQSTAVNPGNDPTITSWGVSTGNPPAGVQYYSSSVGQVCFVNGTGDVVYQDVGALEANTEYTLTADIIANANGVLSGNIAQIALVNTASDSNTNTQVATGTTESSNSILNSLTLTPLTTSFATGNSVSGDLSIELSSGSGQVMFTNVALTSSAVPEPASLGLLAIGALGLLLLKRRRTA